MKVRCLDCNCAMVKVKGKYICSNYHKGLLHRCSHPRFTIIGEEIDDVLQKHNIDKSNVKEFKVNHNNHYQIILHDGTIKGYDGVTIIV